MFSYLRKPSLSSLVSGDTSFSSDNSYIPPVTAPPSAVLRQLVVRDLDQISSTSLHPTETTDERQPFRIPRPLITLPRPLIYVPTDHSLWTPYTRPTRLERYPSTSDLSLETPPSERPVYQNLPLIIVPQSPPPPPTPTPPPPPLPSLSPLPAEYPLVVSPYYRPYQIPVTRQPIRKKKASRIKPPGLVNTLCTGGLSTIAVLIYLLFILALPIAKLVLGVLYVKECPVNKSIPLYLIVSGACGLAIVSLLLLSSVCTFSRSLIKRERSTHGLMLCTIAFSRGMQGAIKIFLFVWFFFGNIWIFGVRYRVRTDKPNDINNYCHPTLYWFAFYVLIFTYVQAFLTCCIKFCVNLCCCGACEIWQKAFS